ncbi:MAG: hypothetical protein A3E88_00095 [Legionellales bacterium RIFCSPHIGHO2_12_FULL_35_11]|nr:MAG: hypothetical protein A3E88_00095 [Legionellales bacterium RIFCSPHIGHO2_12_FULL_35_11]
MSQNLKTILVDLTPVLPGGENGGAKLFVLELLISLANQNSSTNFILLTQEKSHNELSFLDRKNMSRLMVTGNSQGKPSLLSRAITYLFRQLPKIPRKISIVGYRAYAALRRRSLKKILNNIKPNLIFCPFTAPTFAMPNTPSVCVIYDLQYKTHPAFFDILDIANRDHAFTEACRLSTKLISISEYSRNSVLKHGKISPEKIQTIHLRMANRGDENYSPTTSLLESLELKPQQYLLYPANFWQHKNHEMLLTALKIAYHNKDLSEEIKLVCTGAPGQRQQWLINAAVKMGLKSQVIFTGYLKNSDLTYLMQNCSGVIFPSLYEGFGLPILEAMRAGVPVACSNTTSLPEVAGNGAIFFDPRVPTQIANAMKTLVSDNNKRESLIQIGKERVKEFCDINRMSEEYWDVFLKCSKY